MCRMKKTPLSWLGYGILGYSTSAIHVCFSPLPRIFGTTCAKHIPKKRNYPNLWNQSTNMLGDRVYDFLVGLNIEFYQVHVQILGRDQISSLNEVRAIIRSEEIRRDVMLKPQSMESSALVTNKNNDHLPDSRKATSPRNLFQGSFGHTLDRCWKITSNHRTRIRVIKESNWRLGAKPNDCPAAYWAHKILYLQKNSMRKQLRSWGLSWPFLVNRHVHAHWHSLISFQFPLDSMLPLAFL